VIVRQANAGQSGPFAGQAVPRVLAYRAFSQVGDISFSRIMTGIDGTQASARVLAEAVRFASQQKAALLVVGVLIPVQDTLGPGPGFGDTVGLSLTLKARAQAVLSRTKDLFILAGVEGETRLIDACDRDIAVVLLRSGKSALTRQNAKHAVRRAAQTCRASFRLVLPHEFSTTGTKKKPATRGRVSAGINVESSASLDGMVHLSGNGPASDRSRCIV